MQPGSLYRLQDDSAPAPGSNTFSQQLGELTTTFRLLVQNQTKQIAACLKDVCDRRLDSLRMFGRFRRLLELEGRQGEPCVVGPDGWQHGLAGLYERVQGVVMGVHSRPKVFARMLAETQLKMSEWGDFPQNLLYYLLPYYMDLSQAAPEQTHCLSFIEQVIELWHYDLDSNRAKGYTLLDRLIKSCFKTPEIVCYLEQISMDFMEELKKCNLDQFSFNKQMIQPEISIAKQEPKSGLSKIWSSFRKKQKDLSKSILIEKVSSESEWQKLVSSKAEEIMKERQKQFEAVIKNTVHRILKTKVPTLLKIMTRMFHKKISHESERLYDSFCRAKTLPISTVVTELSLDSEQNLKSFGTTSFRSEASFCEIEKNLRHYGYFLLTNLISEQLFNKYQISLGDSPNIKPSQIENVKQIIMTITNLFQGNILDRQKYSDNILFHLQCLLQSIPKFYEEILSIGEAELEEYKYQMQVTAARDEHLNKQTQQLAESLYNLYGRTVLISHKDLGLLLKLVRDSKLRDQLELTQAQTQLLCSNEFWQQFNKQPQTMERVYLFNYCSAQQVQKIENFYFGQCPVYDQPLKQFIGALQQKTIEDNSKVELYPDKNDKRAIATIKKVIASFHSRKLQRKSRLLFEMDELYRRVRSVENKIDYFARQLRGSSTYEYLSEKYLTRARVKIFLRMENDELKFSLSKKDICVNLNSIMFFSHEASKRTQNQELILRNECKYFTEVYELLECIARNSSTQKALCRGRKTEEFNQFFQAICNQILKGLDGFISNLELVHNIDKEEFARLVISKIQKFVHRKCSEHNSKAKTPCVIEKDAQLEHKRKELSDSEFITEDTESLGLDFPFLKRQVQLRFIKLVKQQSIQKKIQILSELLRTVFTIVSFTLDNNKISAEVINPLVQYLIFCTRTYSHHQCLYAMQSLKWRINSELNFNITLYECSLAYILSHRGRTKKQQNVNSSMSTN